ncbi:MAG: phosphohydrolase, partial [Clostridium sp.]
MLKTNETKVLRDPIHGYIHVDLQVIWDCINAKEMQRLRRIHQLGGDFQV